MKGEGMDMFVLRSEKGDRPFYTLSRLKKATKRRVPCFCIGS